MVPALLVVARDRPTGKDAHCGQHAVYPRDRHETWDHEQRTCLYCIDGWVFLGSITHDGEEITESIRCRRCGGTGRSARAANFA